MPPGGRNARRHAALEAFDRKVQMIGASEEMAFHHRRDNPLAAVRTHPGSWGRTPATIGPSAGRTPAGSASSG